MTAGQNNVLALKSWADDIDEMNRDALETYLEGAWPRRGSTRTSRMAIGSEQMREQKRDEVCIDSVRGHPADTVGSLSHAARAD